MKTATGLVIGISGGVGTGTTSLAERLSVHFGLPLRIASKELRSLYEASDKKLSIPDFAMSQEIDAKLEHGNYQFVERHRPGGCVLDARLVLMAMKTAPGAITILLTCSDLEKRVCRVMKRGVSEEDARKDIESRDLQDVLRFGTLYPDSPCFSDPTRYTHHIETADYDTVELCFQHALGLLPNSS